jgi:hypothetical protein
MALLRALPMVLPQDRVQSLESWAQVISECGLGFLTQPKEQFVQNHVDGTISRRGQHRHYA